MPDATAERREYVVELRVVGVAIVCVEADGARQAGDVAAERVRPADVTEVDEVDVVAIAGPFVTPGVARRVAAGRGPQTVPKAAAHVRPA